MKLEWRRITAHTRYPFRIARPGSSVSPTGTEVQRTIVRVDHDGFTGQGEAAPTPYYGQSLDTVEQTLVKAEPIIAEITSLPGLDELDAVIDRLLDGFPDQKAAISAIDMALHDWLGRKLSLPIWRMLGLDPWETPRTSMTIGIDRLDLLEEKVAQAEEFDVLKIKVGTDADVETLTELRRIAPDKLIRVDANCGWPPDQLIERMQAVLPFRLELIEQPTRAGEFDAVREARTVAGAAGVPLIADEDCPEFSAIDALRGVYDGINIKLSKCGGIREARRMVSRARELGLRIMLGCMVETSLGVSAAAQIASLVDYVDLDGHLLLADDPFQGLKLEAGIVLPNESPGLGVTVSATHRI